MAVRAPQPIFIVAQGWPAWLPSVLALKLPIGGIYMKEHFVRLFDGVLPYWHDLRAWPPTVGAGVVMLGSGSQEFMRSAFLPVIPALHRDAAAIFSVDVRFMNSRKRNVDRQWIMLTQHAHEAGLGSSLLRHADFGGATSAEHLVVYHNVAPAVFHPRPSTPRVLKHLLNSATRVAYARSIDPPPPLMGEVARQPLIWEDCIRIEGLLDAFRPHGRIICPSVFTPSKWTKRPLSDSELFRAFDIPVSMDGRLSQFPEYKDFTLGITPLVVTSIFYSWWGVGGVEEVDVSARHQEEGEREEIDVDIRFEGKEELPIEGEDAQPEAPGSEGRSGDDPLMEGSTEPPSESRSVDDPPMESSTEPLGVKPEDARIVGEDVQVEAPETESWAGVEPSRESLLEPAVAYLDSIRRSHDLAKAVKSDDAQVPVHIWDHQVCGREPTMSETQALGVLRARWMLPAYRRKLTSDCTRFMRNKHGAGWRDRATVKATKLSDVEADRVAMAEILWRAAENDWFEYSAGSRLIFFRFPQRYQNLARDGVPVFMRDSGPTSMKAQTSMKLQEKEILRDKLAKMIRKRYLVPPPEKLRSLIQYFAVPKGAEDWRIVYHAGANNLNDSVWAPRFWLPQVSSLLRMVDQNSWMQDRDIGEMFLNFELHPGVRRFTGVDVGPLELEDLGIMDRWFYWTKNLMGFGPSPYNSVKTYLIAEEIIRGDRHDEANPFCWHSIELNLPGTKEYSPNRAWATKRRRDGSLASDMVCFMDDERISGAGPDRVRAAGHAVSTRESYLGIQDALRKLRAAGGEKMPGAWAGAVVHVDDDKGVVLLTSQEKWDRLKAISRKWLERLNAGEEALPHKELQSDRGFMVYVTEAYPAMKPYLKGFHLSLEMWRGGRDVEGWKLKTRLPKAVTVDWEAEASVGDLQETLFNSQAPESGFTTPVPRFKDDLEALLSLTAAESPAVMTVRCKHVITAFYGFGDASSGGFGATVERIGGVVGRFGLWGSDEESESSNYRELLNLVETVEEEARGGHLKNAELWLFTDNSTAESCFVKGSSTSKLLHQLIVRLRKVEMHHGFGLFLVHVAGTRMIDQGTDGLSRGVLMEGVMRGEDMLSFVDLATSAVQRHPPILEYLRDWTSRSGLEPLSPEQWFVEGHGITGGRLNEDGIWIPSHASNGHYYLWAPPPIVGDVALEECLKSVHKRSDAFHIIVLPRLFTPRWSRLFYKCSDFTFRIPAGSPIWPSHLHEPLWIGIVFPLNRFQPWSIRGTPLLVELGRELQEVLSTREADGGDILRKLLRVQRKLPSVPEHVARGMLRMPRRGDVPDDEKK